jgi:DNA-binding transcriptional MerR regulator
MAAVDPRLVKISVLSQMCGVPGPTIKYYIREGLLPEPVRTSRNMAWYDPDLVPRIKAIKRLQTTQFLPLKVIRELLAKSGTPGDAAELDTMVEAVRSVSQGATTSREALLDEGAAPEDMAWLTEKELIGAGAELSAEDASLVRILTQSRREGLSPGLLPRELLLAYRDAVAELVQFELEMFRGGVVPHAGPELTRMSVAATQISERIVVAMRRKLLIPILEQFREE